MQKLEFLLDRYRHITVPDDTVRTEFVRVVKNILDVEIDKGDVSVRKGVLYVKACPALKSELFMRQNKIMDEMKVLLEKKTPECIR
jgi:hypothetical protein